MSAVSVGFSVDNWAMERNGNVKTSKRTYRPRRTNIVLNGMIRIHRNRRTRGFRWEPIFQRGFLGRVFVAFGLARFMLVVLTDLHLPRRIRYDEALTDRTDSMVPEVSINLAGPLSNDCLNQCDPILQTRVRSNSDRIAFHTAVAPPGHRFFATGSA